MPHIVVEGPCTVTAFYESFQPSEHRERAGVGPSLIIKFAGCYLGAGKRAALLETVVVEGSPPKTFFVLLSHKGEGVTVRLLPATDPEKTDGVKTAIALAAERLKAQSPACRYGKTNLEPFLR